MEEYTQITLGQWMSWKEDIRQKLAETAGNFVHIGYRLKQIRDSGMYDGAADIFEFAQREYGLGKSTVSRFIAINEKYSEGGNSLELRAEFRGFSSSKLAEMLTLPDEEISLITEKTTIKEIRELKNFDRQEIKDDGQDTGEKGKGITELQKCIIEYFRNKKELLNRVLGAVHADDIKGAAELINPAGYKTFNKGLIYIFFYSYEQGVKYKQFGQGRIMEMSWQEFLKDVNNIFGDIYGSGEEDIHEAYYGGQTEDPVATSQQVEKPEKTIAETTSEKEKEDDKKEEAVKREDQADPDADNGPADADKSFNAADGTSAGAGETDTADRAGDADSGVAPVQQEEQLAGQMDISQFPQYMPEGHDVAKEVSDAGSSTTADHVEKNDTEPDLIISHDGIELYVENQEESIHRDLYKMIRQCSDREWTKLIETAKGIIERVEGIERIIKVYEQ